MAAILQMTFSSAFSTMKIMYFDWNLKFKIKKFAPKDPINIAALVQKMA